MGIFEKITGTFSRPAGRHRHSHPQHGRSHKDRTASDATIAAGDPPAEKDGAVSSKPIGLGMDGQVKGVITTSVEPTDQSAPTKELLDDGTTKCSYLDGSYSIIDANGQITKTFDVLGVKREFARDRYTGQLMIKRFGTWTKPQSAHIDDDGSLSYTADGVDVIERLNGVHMHFHHDTRTTIITDNVQKTEVVKNPSGEITKRSTTDEGETFGIWNNRELTFFSETFYQPRRHEALTPNGPQALVYVSRAERKILEKEVMEEKFFFRNPIKNERHVTLSLQFGTGLLMLKGVVSVSSIINSDTASETTFELKQAVTLRADLPGYKGSIENVVSVRIFDAGANVGVSFKNINDKQYTVLIAKTTKSFAQMPGNAPISPVSQPVEPVQ